MEIPSGVFIMLGALLAGLITSAVSFLSLVISKEQKVTEFREKRRIRIREETAKFLAEIDTLFKLYESELASAGLAEFTPKQLHQFREKNKDHLRNLSEMRHRMYLRATPERPTRLGELLKAMEWEFYGTSARQEELDRIRDQIIAEVQNVLKYEWKRVKEGEPVYIKTERWALRVIRVSGVVLLIAFIAGLLFFGVTTSQQKHAALTHVPVMPAGAIRGTGK